jgi:hypothetical protein
MAPSGVLAPPIQKPLSRTADTALNAAATFWFLVAAAGQLMFVVYIAAFYGRGVAANDLAQWNKVLARGYVPGDRLGNFALAVHLLLALIITLGGVLQLIPQLRAKFPIFHRWTGRIYISTAFIISLSALYLVWVRGGVVGDVVQHAGVSLNALVIMGCAAMALRTAMARQFGDHRRWALRLFLAVSGVWFFRVGLMFWLILNHGPVGFNPKTFVGPFLSFLSFAQYLLPLAILEIYLRTQHRAGASGKLAMAAALLVLTVAMGVGIFGATMAMWLPRI